MLSPNYAERLERFRKQSLALKDKDRIVTAKLPERPRIFVPRRDSGDDYEAEKEFYNSRKQK